MSSTIRQPIVCFADVRLDLLLDLGGENQLQLATGGRLRDR